MKQIISAADFKKFEVGESYSGKFLKPVLREKDGNEPNQKAGDIIGFLFEDINGDETIIPAAERIIKALTAEGQGIGNFYKITFEGKIQMKNGKFFNRYDVQQYDDEKEFIETNSIKETLENKAPEKKEEIDPDAEFLKGIRNRGKK